MPESLIHVLPPAVANQIAAGEVVERPASVVKELVENSLDAAAGRIHIGIEQAGKSLIAVDDDGCGMSRADAGLCLLRHATSKIRTAADLHAIASCGFRGEALPSIASVSRLRLHTGQAGKDEGSLVEVSADGRPQVRPAPPRRGTRVEVRDLFLRTPARKRFLRSDRTEEAAVVEMVRALALAYPGVAMQLHCDGHRRLQLPRQSMEERIRAVMGGEFAANSVAVTGEHEGIHISGRCSLPTFHHRDASRMVFLVNGRVVRDKGLLAALRAAYRDVMFHDRYPVAVLALDMDPARVDVNVHPAKREVRFASPQAVRAAVVTAVRAAIDKMGRRVASTPSHRALAAMRPATGHRTAPAPPLRELFSAPRVAESPASYAVAAAHGDRLDLGRPLAQIHRCYILAQTADGVVLVDQHAAHERIAYELLKRQLLAGEIQRQALLAPADWRADAATAAWVHEHASELAAFGFEVDPVALEQFAIRAVPAMLVEESPQELLAELVAALRQHGVKAEGSGRILERWLANRACKGALKSGRILNLEEQDALLREMERTPNIGQCNHGRPTYVRLSLYDLERLFGRRG